MSDRTIGYTNRVPKEFTENYRKKVVQETKEKIAKELFDFLDKNHDAEFVILYRETEEVVDGMWENRCYVYLTNVKGYLYYRQEG